MVYLCTDLIAAPGAVVQTTRVGTAWSKISGPQPELAYLARAQVIVGSNPTRPTIHLNLREFAISFPEGRWARGPSLLLAQSYYLEVRSFG